MTRFVLSIFVQQFGSNFYDTQTNVHLATHWIILWKSKPFENTCTAPHNWIYFNRIFYYATSTCLERLAFVLWSDLILTLCLRYKHSYTQQPRPPVKRKCIDKRRDKSVNLCCATANDTRLTITNHKIQSKSSYKIFWWF